MKCAKRSVKMWTTNFYKSFSKNILLYMSRRLSKISSVHTYVMLRTVYFGWFCTITKLMPKWHGVSFQLSNNIIWRSISTLKLSWISEVMSICVVRLTFDTFWRGLKPLSTSLNSRLKHYLFNEVVEHNLTLNKSLGGQQT